MNGFISTILQSRVQRLVRFSLCALVAWIALQIFSQGIAFAADHIQDAPLIFDVRRSLPLEPSEPSYHDFYINAGAEVGLKKGLYITVVRLVSVHDPIQNKQQGELPINVARLQVLQVSGNMTVARLVSEFTDEERPTLEFESVMIGDRVDLSTLSADAPKPPAKKRTHVRAESVSERNGVELSGEVRAQESGTSAPGGPPGKSEAEQVHVATPPPESKPSGGLPSEPQAERIPAGKNPPNEATNGKNSNPEQPQEKPSPQAMAPDIVRVPVPAVSETEKGKVEKL